MNELDKVKRKTTKQLKNRLITIGLVIIIVAAVLFLLSSLGTPDKSTSPTAIVTAKQDCASQNNCIGIDAFREELKKFETALEPRLSITRDGSWNSKQIAEIAEYKDLALRAFSTANYTTAFSHIKQAGDIASSLIKAAEQKFDFNYSEAQSRFENNEFILARDRIDDALKYNSENIDALKLKERILVLPQVLALRTNVQIAQTENNLVAEKGYLERIVKLDPERIIAGQRLKLLVKLIAEQKFQQHISKGFSAINTRNLNGAKAALAQAQRLYPGRKEIQLLDREVKDLAQKLGLEYLLSNAQAQAQGDRWQSALNAFNRALQEDANNSRAIEGAKIATIMVTTLDETNQLLDKPERITSPEVRAFAKGLLEKSENLTTHSPLLEKKLSRLKALVIAAERAVDIRLVSDNKTDIYLRNFGALGKMDQKIIQLKPGTYYFEGRRKGYRSKTVTFHVPLSPSGTLAEVRIMLDE